MATDEHLKITVITDTHYYSPQIGTSGEAYDDALLRSQKLLDGSRELLIAAFNQIADDSSSDIVLLSGDVTNDGETVSHEEFRELLRSLKSRGKKVYVITATHDYHKSKKCKKYVGDKIESTPALAREELYDYYHEFGPDDALCSKPEFMSYIVQLPNNCRLFALNDDLGFNDEMMEWLSEQAEDARKNNQFIISMTHHPIIPPSPMYEIIGKNDMHRCYKKRREQFADMGIQFMLTGHTHTHNIGRIFSPRGNAFYAISTGSLIGYPAPIRHLTIGGEQVLIETDTVTYPTGLDVGGLTLEQHLKKQLIGVIADMIKAAGGNTERFAYMAQAISINPKLIYKFGWLMKPFFRWVNSVRFKTFAKWTKKETGYKKKDWKKISNDKVVDFIIELVSNLFSGENSMTPDDPKCRIYLGFLKIADSVLHFLKVDIGKLTGVAPNATELLAPLACKGEFDAYKTILPINSFVPYGEHRDVPVKCNPFDGIKKSKKGAAIVLIGALAALVLLPLIALWLIFGFLINQIKYGKRIRGKK